MLLPALRIDRRLGLVTLTPNAKISMSPLRIDRRLGLVTLLALMTFRPMVLRIDRRLGLVTLKPTIYRIGNYVAD